MELFVKMHYYTLIANAKTFLEKLNGNDEFSQRDSLTFSPLPPPPCPSILQFDDKTGWL